MFKKLLSLGALLVVSLAPSSAATISFSDTVNTTFAPDTLSFTLSQFDASLGTLTGILFEYSAELNGEFAATNLSNSDGTLTGTMSGAFTLTGPAPLAAPLLTLSAMDNLGPRAVLAGETIAFSVLGATDSDSYATSIPAELLPFIGLGTVGFDGTANALASPIANFTPLLFGADLSGSATVKITYEYEEKGVPDVPEPMSLYLMGGGLLGLSFIRRARTSKKSA
jgi:hypothetical protein